MSKSCERWRVRRLGLGEVMEEWRGDEWVIIEYRRGGW